MRLPIAAGGRRATFRLGPCNWNGLEFCEAYAWGSVLACSLIVVARHLLA